MIKLKRAYEKPSREDGLRILVERLWPRGLTKARAVVDLWLKEVAPSPALRKWLGHDPALARTQNFYRPMSGRYTSPVELAFTSLPYGPEVCD